ncbi:MAG: DUF433 domain-containing protein [Chloroflexi bacterium]|nr:DUF433 domain-containing protein [Chloroflexota bacterium]
MTTKAPVNIGNLIHSRTDLHSGRPCLAGTGMTVHAVAVLHLQGMSAEQIFEEFPHLDLARIHAALAYYFANRERIDADLDADDALYDELVRKYPRGWTRETDL